MVLIVAFICVAVLIFGQMYVYKKFWDDRLDVEISYKNVYCVAEEENELVEVIVNHKWLPLPMMHVKFDMPKSFVFENENNSSVSDYYYRDDVFSIMGNQSVTRILKFRCMGRGCFYMHDTNITCGDLFQRTTFTARRKNEKVIHVFPKKIGLEFLEAPFNTITGNFVTNKTLIEDPFEFRGIREYQPYDGIRHINWKSSARNGELKVNTYFMTSSQTINVILNIDTQTYSRSDRMIEYIISLASSICEKLINEGIPTGLTTNGKDIYTEEHVITSVGSGVKHMVAIDTALARLDAHADNFNFADILSDSMDTEAGLAGAGMCYIIISNNRSKEVVNVYKAAKQGGAQAYFIIPEYRQYQEEEDIPDAIHWNIEL